MAAFRIAPQFGTAYDRDAVNDKIADYHPYWLVGIHKALDAGRSEGESWPIDKLQITVSPPNEQGFDICRSWQAGNSTLPVFVNPVPRFLREDSRQRESPSSRPQSRAVCSDRTSMKSDWS